MPKSQKNRYAAAAILTVLIMTVTFITYGQQKAFINPGFFINTRGDDFSPSCTMDGSTIVFSSRSEVESSHKIFTCVKENGQWSEPRPILEVSSEANEETPFISSDGQVLLFSSDRPGGYSPSATADGNKRITFDIYISRKKDGQWSIPVLLPGEVNTAMNERAPSLSPDGKTLFFTRFPYRNIKKSAIFMATYENGKYVNVKQLPESINQGRNEISFLPSYKEPGKYCFASRRSGGFGGWDIYYTLLGENGFSEPVNAGDSINTMFDEIFLQECGDISMFCSNRPGGLGGYDLYFTALLSGGQGTVDKATPEKTGVIITVRDSKTGHIIPGAEIILYRHDSEAADDGEMIICDKKGVASVETAPGEKWLLVKPSGREHSGRIVKIKLIYGKIQHVEITATVVEHSLYSGNDKEKNGTIRKYDSKTADKGDDEKKAGISSLTCEGIPELKPVYFRFNSTEIRTDYIPVLHRIIDYMRQNPEVKIIIRGHADSRGSKRVNYKISRKRAEKVFIYFKSMGIEESRMKIIPMGETDPQVTGGNNNNALNRRVEFEFSTGMGFSPDK